MLIMATIGVRIDSELWQKFKESLDENGMTISGFFRKAIKAELAKAAEKESE